MRDAIAIGQYLRGLRDRVGGIGRILDGTGFVAEFTADEHRVVVDGGGFRGVVPVLHHPLFVRQFLRILRG